MTPSLRVSVNNGGNPTKNQITSPAGFSYDLAGNNTADGAYTYTYDAESRIITANGMTGGPYCYTYDGNGMRVMKSHASGGSCTGSVTVDMLYWRSTSGSTIAETDGTGSTTNSGYHEYIFFGGKRIARRSPASSSLLPVQNSSFETHNALDQPFVGGPYNLGPIPSWTMLGSGGSWQPNSTVYTALSDGSIVAYNQDGATISQTLTGVSLQPNSTYTLTVAVGHRSDGYGGNYTIALQAGSTVLNSVSGSNNGIPSGTFADQTLTYTTGSSVTSGNLGIVLTNAGGVQINFDNVRLSVIGSGDAISYYFTDHLGSTRVVTNSSGSPCYEADFLPYGTENTPAGFSNTCSTNYKFTGYERDAETAYGTSSGNDYAFARYYNARLGRFMSGDPLDGDTSDPQSLDKYTYVRNNPVNMTDPSGLCGSSFTDGGGGGGGVCIGIGIGWGWGLGGGGSQSGLYWPPDVGKSPNPFSPGDSPSDNPFSGEMGSGGCLWCELPPTIPHLGVPGMGVLSCGNCGVIIYGLTAAQQAAAARKRLQWLIDFLRHVPWSVTFFDAAAEVVPGVGVGPSATFSYIPDSKTFCVGGGIGIATEGKAANGGPLVLGDLRHAKSILTGPGWSGGGQLNPYEGAQATVNSSGALGGPTVGSTGASLSYNINSWCTGGR